MSKDNPNEELNFEIGDRVAGFRIVEKIDEGGFGQVFKVTKDQKTFAMKIENNAMEGGSAIKLEISVFKGLILENVFPRFISGGKKIRYHYLVLELLGDNLRMLKYRSPHANGFSEGTWSRVGIQCLFALKTMHNNGFVHRDVKPNNFAIGLDSRCRFILAFDFGLARKFIKKEDKKRTLRAEKSLMPIPSREVPGNSKESIMPRKTGSTNTLIVETPVKTDKTDKTDKMIDKEKTVEESAPTKSEKMAFRVARPHTDFRGTHMYASPNAHSLKELGRADDVWSLLYMVAELFTDLPWASNDMTPIEAQKDRNTLRDIYKNAAFDSFQMRQIDEMETMLRTCDYYSHPNYDLVHQFLLGVLKKSGVAWNSPFDWESPEQAAAALKLSAGVPMRWCNPGDFFKFDKWARLEVPGGRSSTPWANLAPAKTSIVQKSKIASKKGSKKSKKTSKKASKKQSKQLRKPQAPSRQAVKMSKEDSTAGGCETPIVKSVIQKRIDSSTKKSKEKV